MAPPGRNSIFHPVRHDHSVALWKAGSTDVELIAYWELERLSAQKHHDWPLYHDVLARDLLEFLLAEEGLRLSDISGIWGTPGLGANDSIRRVFGAGPLPIHSLAHLYTSLLIDTDLFREHTIVAMALDPSPDFTLETMTKRSYYAGAVSTRSSVTTFPIDSPGPLYFAAQAAFGMEAAALVALATETDSAINADPLALLDKADLSGGLGIHRTGRHLVDVLTQQAQQEISPSEASEDGGFSYRELVAGAVMKVVQRASELICVRNVERLIAASGVDPASSYLGMSGGTALNGKTNALLMESFGFRGLLIPPCAGDSGQALGLGLLGLVAEGVIPKARFRLDSAFVGSHAIDVPGALREWALEIANVSDFDESVFCDDVSRGPVAWVDGRAEIGPRALGHRNLLADPRAVTARDQINTAKGRPSWRPVAPVVLEEEAVNWFEPGRRSPYMSEVQSVREARRSLVPAVVHKDGSAEVQTLSAYDDSRLYRAIGAFRKRTGIPMLCSASLNEKFDPIVATASQALNFCIRRGIPVAYLAGQRVELSPGIKVPPTPSYRSGWLFSGQEPARDEIWNGWRDAGFTDEELYLMCRAPELVEGLREPAGRRRLTAAVTIAARNPDFHANVARFVGGFGPGSRFAPRWA